MKPLLTLLALAFLTISAVAADGPVKHVVHFKFKPAATSEQIAKIVAGFAELKSKISEVESIEAGTNISPEGFDKGYTHCWIVTFRDTKGRDAYLVHPAHKAFVEILMPSLEDALVIDFIPQK